ncbi:hypothetical protein NMXN1568_1270, partial [Neisseria meningitidis N1568]
MKKQITAAVMMLSMIAPAMANGLDNQTFENQVFHTQADAPMQLAELSQRDERTDGLRTLVHRNLHAADSCAALG